MRTRQVIENLVRCATTGLTETQVSLVTDYIAQAEMEGINSSVWHACAAVLRGGKNCNCGACYLSTIS